MRSLVCNDNGKNRIENIEEIRTTRLTRANYCSREKVIIEVVKVARIVPTRVKHKTFGGN